MCNTCAPQTLGYFHYNTTVTITKREETPAERYKRVGYAALRAIADYVQCIPDCSWNMTVWTKDTSCGTVGCAIGSTTHLAAVKATGLTLAGLPYAPKVLVPAHGSNQRYEAIESAFGITWEQATDLFCHEMYPGGNATKAQVAARLYKFLLDHPTT